MRREEEYEAMMLQFMGIKVHVQAIICDSRTKKDTKERFLDMLYYRVGPAIEELQNLMEIHTAQYEADGRLGMKREMKEMKEDVGAEKGAMP